MTFFLEYVRKKKKTSSKSIDSTFSGFFSLHWRSIMRVGAGYALSRDAHHFYLQYSSYCIQNVHVY